MPEERDVWGEVLWAETPISDEKWDPRACWRTPPEVFGPLQREFRFSLDAAARDGTNLLPWWFGPDHSAPARRDAFEASWLEGCGARALGIEPAAFINPPYGRRIGRWIRLARQWGAGDNGKLTTVVLVLARTETPWWHHEVMRYAAEVRFVRRRVKFLELDGTQGNGAPAPSVVIVFRPGHVGPPVVSSFMPRGARE